VNKVLQRIHDIGLAAWLRFVQSLNAIAGVLLGGIVLLNVARPQLAAELTASLSPIGQLGLGIFWCSVVHYALRRAKKAGE
jgi:uncharacterized membrane protein